MDAIFAAECFGFRRTRARIGDGSLADKYWPVLFVVTDERD